MSQDNQQGRKAANKPGMPGAPEHPVVAGVGAVAGAVGAGAAMGTVAGPIGTVLGAAAGAIAGGVGAEAVAQAVDRDGEETHWRANYRKQPYVAEGASYDDYGPAYRYGVDAYGRKMARSFEHAEAELSLGWEKVHGKSALAWEHAKLATRDAWDRLQSPARHSK